MMTSQLDDVWIHIVGSRLSLLDIANLSMVNSWGNRIARKIENRRDLIVVATILKFERVSVAWPYLRIRLELLGWTQPKQAGVLDRSEKNLCCEELTFDQCQVSRFGFVLPEKLKEFVLRDPVMWQDSSMNDLSSFLTRSIHLRSLTLRKVIQNYNVTWLCLALTHLTQLNHLDLSCNTITSKSVCDVCACLRQLPHINSLSLAENAILGPGVQAVCACVSESHAPSIRVLNFAKTSAGNDGAIAIATFAPKFTKLYWLNFSGNFVTKPIKALVGSALGHVHTVMLS
eukprot:c10342_g1_i1.p1 GENE.c10342_g1_i1~~c10342_g1_i1.p1  ORF type:complete len:312 (+),score=75.39 c10342_g1_i1:76-936(+)